MNFTKIRVGISSCLLGQKVRFDGGHKRNGFIAVTLADYVEFVPVCPEMGIGMGVPREPIRLTGEAERPRAVGVRDSSIDVTDALERFALRQAGALDDIGAYIFKKDSPSCGMERVKLFKGQGAPERKASGIYARVFMEQLPLLPVEEEGRLNDPVLRENFVNRMYVYARWQQLIREGLSAQRLIGFHSDHKYMVMAHSQAAYQRMGRLLSDLSGVDKQGVGELYVHELMQALRRRAGRKRHSNVLQHMMGYLKRSIDSYDKRELGQAIDAYRNAEIPLIVPITLLRHYFRRHPDPYMERQHYLRPHPDKLGLLNTI